MGAPMPVVPMPVVPMPVVPMPVGPMPVGPMPVETEDGGTVGTSQQETVQAIAVVAIPV